MADGPTLAAAYRGCRDRVVHLLAGVDAGAAERHVPACPEWSVRLVVAHLASNASETLAGNLPDFSDMATWVQTNVAARADAPLADLVAEWLGAGPGMDGLFEQFGESLTAVVYDTVSHEHDIRHALGAPGARDSDAVRIGARAVVRRLGERISERGLSAIAVEVDGERHICGPGEARLTLRGDAFSVLRLLSNRRSRAQVLAADWDGDPTPWMGAIEVDAFPSEDLEG